MSAEASVDFDVFKVFLGIRQALLKFICDVHLLIMSIIRIKNHKSNCVEHVRG